MANKIISLFRNYKRHSAAAVLVFLLILPMLALPQQTHAADWKWMCWYMTGQNRIDCEKQINTTVDIKGAIVDKVLDATVGNFYLGIASILLAISNTIFFFAGWLIDLILPYFTADLSHNAGVIAGWGTFRDITNLFFIFIMLAISIATILRLESYGAKALLARLVMVALLINFSLPIAKVIIDINNVVASVFYEQLTAADEAGKKKVSEKINNLTGLATVFSGETLKSMQNAETQANNFSIATIFLGISGILIVSSFIFLAFAILLIIRNIYLGFLIMLSPLAFLGMVLPYTQGYAKQWWEKLIKQSLIAPVGFMMLYAAINILSKLSAAGFATTNAKDLGGAFIGQSTQFPMLYNFMIVIGVLIGALVVTQSLGAMGASTAIAWGQGAYKGAKGYAGKQTYGRAATAIDKRYGEQMRAISPTLGTLLSGGLKGLGAGYAKSVEARVQGVTSIKNPELQAKALANLSEAERKTAWSKLNVQQKAGVRSSKAGKTEYKSIINALEAEGAKKEKEAAAARIEVAISGAQKKQETAKGFDQWKFAALEGELAKGSGADTKKVSELVGELAVLGKNIKEIGETLSSAGNTQSAEIAKVLNSSPSKIAINAILQSQKPPQKEKGDTSGAVPPKA